MAGIAGLIISAVGTGVTLLSYFQGVIEDAESDYALIGYVIANDGANGELSGAGGHLPDVRAWDDTGEFLAGNSEGTDCGEGETTCTTKIYTDEAPTYTLFTGNSDAICIAWTGIAFAGSGQKYGFHPGQWAYGCDSDGDNGGSWYYAGTSVPGLDYDKENIYCAWVDKDGDSETTGFQVHWPEYDGEAADVEEISYYCDNRPPVAFRTDYDPSTVWYWTPEGILNSSVGAPNATESLPAPAEDQGDTTCPRTRGRHRGKHGAGHGKRRRHLSEVFASDTRIIKSRRPKHSAAELCDPSRKAVGQNFVSYTEKQFCYMPTKTLFPFCELIEDGPCWDDGTNRIVAKGRVTSQDVPSLSHIDRTITWE